MIFHVTRGGRTCPAAPLPSPASIFAAATEATNATDRSDSAAQVRGSAVPLGIVVRCEHPGCGPRTIAHYLAREGVQPLGERVAITLGARYPAGTQPPSTWMTWPLM